MKVFITGCNGLIGSFIARRFLAEGYELVALKRKNSDLSFIQDFANQIEWIEGDLLDIPALEKGMEHCVYVIHCAAIVSFNPKEKSEMYQINIEGTANVVNTALKYKIKKLCHISSIAALGRKKDTFVINENSKWEDSSANTHYAKTKYLSELEVWRAQAEGLATVILNPSVVLGPGDWNKSSSQVFKYIWDKKSYYSLGQLNYIDVRDLAEITYQLTVSDAVNDRFIINGGFCTYKTFFDHVADNLNKPRPSKKITPFLAAVAWRVAAIYSLISGKPPFITRETASVAQKSYTYENSKISDLLNYTFRELDETVKWTCAELIKYYQLDVKS